MSRKQKTAPRLQLCYGNRSSHSNFVGTNQFAPTNITDPTIDPNTNRFNTGQGYIYDKNGNITADAESRSITFNADNKQTEVKDANGATIGEYYFDGEGKCVKKVTATETTVFVYSNGKLIAEYSTAPPTQNPTTSYTATDQLGSPRVITNALGEVVSRRDFRPFGEEVTPDGTYRTANLVYTSADNIRQKFTGYQKDEETGLDFAEARMYESRHGRFTAVDPLLASGKSANPQSFNRYLYCLDNPLLVTDPGGLQVGSPTGSWYMADRQRPKYVINGEVAPDGFIPVPKDSRGRYTYQSPGLDENQVIQLNPYGPGAYPNVKEFLLDAAVGGAIWGNSWYRGGYKEAFSTEYLDSTVEPVVGVRDASLDFYSIVMPLGTGGKAVMEGAVSAFGRAETETFYRTMTGESANAFLNTGRMPAGSETFVTTDRAVAETYSGVTMKIEVKAGTTSQLEKIGVRNAAAAHPYPNMPLVGKGWMERKAFFKLEDDILNIGLGNGNALNIFNCNVVNCGVVR